MLFFVEFCTNKANSSLILRVVCAFHGSVMPCNLIIHKSLILEMVDPGTSTLWLESDFLIDYAIKNYINFELNVMTEDMCRNTSVYCGVLQNII